MWAVYALLSAFFVATTDPISKKALKDKTGDEYVIGWAMLFMSTPFLALFYLSGKPATLNPGLIKALVTAIPFEILATVLYYKALRLTDISLSVPFIALTPLFIILTGFLFLGERVMPAGAIGIALITLGAYSLNLKEARHGLITPIKAIFLNKGSFYMALVALIFSITAVVSKQAMLCSNPEAIPFIYNLSVSLAMAPLVLYRLRKGLSAINNPRKTTALCLLLGFLSALSSIFYFQAVSRTNVAYAISIKRLSLLMSIGYGWLFFRERDIHIRFFSAFCMLLGVVLITLSR